MAKKSHEKLTKTEEKAMDGIDEDIDFPDDESVSSSTDNNEKDDNLNSSQCDDSDEEDQPSDDEFSSLDTQPHQITEDTRSKKTFSEVGVCSWLVQQLKVMHIKTTTPVQAHCIPKVLEGLNILGCAQTGTGKTLAFALPILQKLAVDPYGVFALVLTPTRELASQIADQFIALGKPISLKCSVIIGGRSLIDQAHELTTRPHIVVATPGRLADHIESDPEVISKIFRKVKIFVLDEADRMLEGQFNEQLKAIFGSLPKKRQTLLFSATITNEINQLHKISVDKPYYFEDKGDVTTVSNLTQKYVVCPIAVKDAYLVYVVKSFSERNPKSSIIIFAQTCRECQALAYMFDGLGFHVGSLHSQIAQKTRMSTLAAFRTKTLKVLICTDVAARGLDINHVDLVVNHNVPQCPKTYVHRVGRSARAGRFGAALTFITQYDVVLLQEVEKLIGKKLEEQKVNERNVSKYVTKVLVAKKEAELKLEQQKFGEKKEINKRKQLLLGGMAEEEVDKYMENMKNRRKVSTKRKTTKIDDALNKKKKKKKVTEA